MISTMTNPRDTSDAALSRRVPVSAGYGSSACVFVPLTLACLPLARISFHHSSSFFFPVTPVILGDASYRCLSDHPFTPSLRIKVWSAAVCLSAARMTPPT